MKRRDFIKGAFALLILPSIPFDFKTLPSKSGWEIIPEKNIIMQWGEAKPEIEIKYPIAFRQVYMISLDLKNTFCYNVEPISFKIKSNSNYKIRWIAIGKFK